MPVKEEKCLTRAQSLFSAAGKEYQGLLREIIRDERELMHLKRRVDIHHRIYEHVKRVVK